MNKTVDTVGSSLTIKQRAPKTFYEPSLKARVVAECSRAGASIAGIALNHGLNANMVHRWLDEYEAGIGWAKHIERQSSICSNCHGAKRCDARAC
ncbi:transposase [Limnohabitans curvus]|uniref:transposase n=1 Tax=Limnohabitans curvus TaxID=323423 RepID=UPI000D3DC396